MDTNTRIRVIIHCRGAGADLFRTLISLACQTVGSQCLHVVLASTAPQDHLSGEAKLLHDSLGFKSLDVQDARGAHHTKALNTAVLGGQEDIIALVPEGARLSPRFVSSCLPALEQKQAQAAFPTHTAGSPDKTPFARLLPFSSEQLTRFNPVGPVTLVRRKAWEEMGGLRPDVQLAMWDFWLRLALAGGVITRVPELLAFCPPLHKLPPWQDGQAKALLVIASHGAFEASVCRWALALLRGEAWASPFATGLIPNPREVQSMFAGLPAAPPPGPWNWNGTDIRTA
ncbi:MAG: hypothetical protein Q8O35_10795 [Humidesulfovibrio sp.]|uniref:hypothetical protein n=1 Tax=Humidesulfovibrio sp. TaxID=2910988 RepID=UPI0027329F08|nr:hypothetical protein [Humidesulfovibrio sp.]MDP2848661.1 hypothetical protein [Humidesulfovibrio sp.]